MNGIFWIVLGAMTGWLTGTLMGKEGNGKRLLGGYTRSSLDIFFGVVGACIGGYLSGPSSGRVALLAVMRPQPLAPLLLWDLSGKSPQDTPLLGVRSDSFRFE